MNNLKTKVPIWFWIVAVIFFLWNIMGVLSFFMHTFMPEDALALLPEKERQLYDSYPMWGTVLFAVGVFCGLLGSLGLLLKKKWSKQVFIISLFAVIIQMIHNVFFTGAIEIYGLAQAATMPAVVILLGLLAVWFSNSAVKKNWLK
ncbi:MAG: hypothetical protein COA33_006565 [Fluviicola sp.]|nr:hypothetical protein [Fluviicola sp.]